MALRDKIYLRFFLFNQRYGRIWCAFIEGLVIGTLLLIAILSAVGAVHLSMWMYESYTTAQERVVKAQKEAKAWERSLIACLNAELIAVTDKEMIGCEGARSFKK